MQIQGQEFLVWPGLTRKEAFPGGAEHAKQLDEPIRQEISSVPGSWGGIDLPLRKMREAVVSFETNLHLGIKTYGDK
jgi:hypothetical protein